MKRERGEEYEEMMASASRRRKSRVPLPREKHVELSRPGPKDRGWREAQQKEQKER